MSLIEQMKTEAIALREAQNARGIVLKHSEALEQVAKKHGYASWRAALAVLQNENQKPQSSAAPSTTPVTDELLASTLEPGESEIARLDTFTRWLSRDLRQAAVSFNQTIGLLPIYTETSQEGTRYLFWRIPTRAFCEVRSDRTKAQFEEFDSSNRSKGHRLLSLHVSADQRYSAVWIASVHYARAASHLRRFGISPVTLR